MAMSGRCDSCRTCTPLLLLLLLLVFSLSLVPARGAPGGGGRDAGILYEVRHASAAHAMSLVRAAGGVPLTTERVIASAGKHSLDDVYAKHNISADIWNAEVCLSSSAPRRVLATGGAGPGDRQVD